jgi:hypothetical protein
VKEYDHEVDPKNFYAVRQILSEESSRVNSKRNTGVFNSDNDDFGRDDKKYGSFGPTTSERNQLTQADKPDKTQEEV